MATKLRKKFRVASSGATIDGRQIKGEWLKQAAENYDPSEYAARINVDHQKWTGAFGDIHGFEVKEQDGRVDLYADIELNERGRWVNEAGQKMFASIELHDSVPNMSGMYITGMAMTDQPASMRTERLQFSAFSRNKTVLTFDTELTAEEIQAFMADDEDKPTSPNAWAAGLRKFVSDKFAVLGKSHDKGIAGVQEAVGGIVTDLTEQFTKRAQADAERIDQLTATVTELQTQLGTVSEDFKQLKSSLDGKPANEFKQRPASTGGAGQQLTEF